MVSVSVVSVSLVSVSVVSVSVPSLILQYMTACTVVMPSYLSSSLPAVLGQCANGTVLHQGLRVCDHVSGARGVLCAGVGGERSPMHTCSLFTSTMDYA